MRNFNFRAGAIAVLAVIVVVAGTALPAAARNKVLGGIQFVLSSKDQKTSGVWVDGQYVGYIAELKGNKQLLMVPGEHEISIRQAGYTSFTQKVTIEPGKNVKVFVVMKKDTAVQYSKITAQVKLDVDPDRAAVFLDGVFAGTVREFNGWGRAMLVNPGEHSIKIALPGYQPFATRVDLVPNQKYTLKTKLIHGSMTEEGPALKTH